MSSGTIRSFWHAHNRQVVVALVCAAVALWVLLYARNAQIARAQQFIDIGIESFHAGRMKDAERDWLAASKLTPDNAGLWDLLAEYYIRSEQWNKGSVALANVLRIDPTRPYIYSRMAACALRSGNELEAQRLAQEELKRNPSDGASLSIMAFLSQMQENTDQQIVYLRRILDHDPNDAETLRTLAQAYYSAGKFSEIIPIADRLIAINTAGGQAYALRGAARYEISDSPTASAQSEADMLKALGVDPLSAFARFALGKVYMREAQYPKAIFQLTLAQKLYPRKMDVPFELATAYTRAGQPAKAAEARQRFETLRNEATNISVLEKKASLQPANFQVHLQLGQFFLQAENNRKALYYIQKALALKPNDPHAKQAYKQLVDQFLKGHAAPQ